MAQFLFLIIIEVLTLIALHQHFYKTSHLKYYSLIVSHILLSIWLYTLFFRISVYNGPFDTPQNIWLNMNLTGMICGVVVPRFILSLFHFTGKLIRIKKGNHIRSLTNTGLVISIIIFLIIANGTLSGRFNFKKEEVIIKIRGLNKNLDGLKIVQLSDIHLPGFYHHQKLLRNLMDEINRYKPDLIINTGDFVNYGWQEFDKSDTILSIAKSRYGNFAVLGNHDIGTYHPNFTEGDIENNISRMNLLISASGYRILNDENTSVEINGRKIVLIGVITRGRHPRMIHGNLTEAMKGIDSADLKILLAHDPNQWEKDVAGKTDIDLTLSGHTHGMQMGVLTKKFKWSPSQYFYPNWSGLYTAGNQHLYVSRGLGVLAIPFRIWMPPEITIITIKSF
jgi:uncharacterized protein